MKKDTLDKVLSVAQKNPKGVMGLRWYLLICHDLDIVAKPADEKVAFSANGKEANANLITEENAGKFKCQVKPGTESILLFEFIDVLVNLLTDRTIPEKNFDKMGERAEYYVSEGSKILEEHLQLVNH